MKKYSLPILLLIFVSLFAGCVTPSQQNNLVAPSSTNSIPTDVIVQNKYVIGDVIAKTPNELTSAMVVYDVSPQTKKYQLDTIYPDLNNQWRYRMYPNIVSQDAEVVEKTYPYVITHVEISKVITNY